MARTPFKLRSGNTTPFKSMGSSPIKDNGDAKTLHEYYKKKMPSLSDRAIIFAEHGGEGEYKGTKSQNIELLSKLKGAEGGYTVSDTPGMIEDVDVSKQSVAEGFEGPNPEPPKTKPKPKSLIGAIKGIVGKEAVKARQKKYNPEGKSMHEQKLEKVKGTGQWKRMSKFEQKAHQRKIEKAKASRVKKQETKTKKED